MTIKDFVIQALDQSLQIIEGKWDKERDWESYIIARQYILASLDLIKPPSFELEADRLAKASIDDFVWWLTENEVYFCRRQNSGRYDPTSKTEVVGKWLEHRNGKRKYGSEPDGRRRSGVDNPEPRSNVRILGESPGGGSESNGIHGGGEDGEDPGE